MGFLTLHKDRDGEEIQDLDRVFRANGDPSEWGTVGGFADGRVLVEWDADVGRYEAIDGERLIVA